MKPYKQFNVWYYDFGVNEKKIAVFTQIENALKFAYIVATDKRCRFISIESVY